MGAAHGPPGDGGAVVTARGAAVAFGPRVLWQDLDLAVAPGEFLAVLGPNGAGKSTFLKAVLGQQALSAGALSVAGRAAGHNNRAVGYIPQQRAMDAGLPLRARDVVALGIDGHRWGLRRRRQSDRRRAEEALDAVGGSAYADAPVGLLSGGEQQRVRVAQAIATDPTVLLCDEPLLSLDLLHQRAVSSIISRRRREHGTAVLFVTHEINPVLDQVDRVLYIANGQHRLGTPQEVMNSPTLSELYGTAVDVLTVRGRIIVVGTPDGPDPTSDHHHVQTPLPTEASR